MFSHKVNLLAWWLAQTSQRWSLRHTICRVTAWEWKVPWFVASRTSGWFSCIFWTRIAPGRLKDNCRLISTGRNCRTSCSWWTFISIRRLSKLHALTCSRRSETGRTKSRKAVSLLFLMFWIGFLCGIRAITQSKQLAGTIWANLFPEPFAATRSSANAAPYTDWPSHQWPAPLHSWSATPAWYPSSQYPAGSSTSVLHYITTTCHALIQVRQLFYLLLDRSTAVVVLGHVQAVDLCLQLV